MANLKTASRKRERKTTRDRILAAGRAEFSRYGFNGARIERIARKSRCNIRMIYHYFGRKEQFYLFVLEDTYRRLREEEHTEDLRHMEPRAGIQRLVEFTFDYLVDNPVYVGMLVNENLLRAKFLKKSKNVPETTPSRLQALEALLQRGQAEGIFRKVVDPAQLFITILALCFIHLSNRYTLSVMFGTDLSDPSWLAQRRRHVLDVVMSFLDARAAAPISDPRPALVG
jgi:TetR/AcrR family transcriptional regulator